MAILAVGMGVQSYEAAETAKVVRRYLRYLDANALKVGLEYTRPRKHITPVGQPKGE
jgi:hypothetical protein